MIIIIKLLSAALALLPILGLCFIIVRSAIYVLAYPTYVGLQYLESALPTKSDSLLILKKPKQEKHKFLMDLFGSIATLQSLIILFSLINAPMPLDFDSIMDKVPLLIITTQLVSICVVYFISHKYGEKNNPSEENDWFARLKKFKTPPPFRVFKD